MKYRLLIALACASCVATASLASDPLAPDGVASRPALPPVKPVTETLWGRQVTDDYRYMEALDPQSLAWIGAQGDYARSVLDAIPPRAALEARIAAFNGYADMWAFVFWRAGVPEWRPRPPSR